MSETATHEEADLTPKDVAANLQLSVWTVLGYFRNGTLPGYQTAPRGEWRIEPDAFRQWKKDRRDVARTVTDPNRIEPRSTRSRAAMNRKNGATR